MADAFFQVSTGHAGNAKRESSLDACLLCTLRDGGTIKSLLEDLRERGTMQGVITSLS